MKFLRMADSLWLMAKCILFNTDMLTKGDISDVISEYLSRGLKPVPAASRASKPLPKRVFITDWEMKRLVKPGQKSVKVPAGAIVSPLSLDWLDYNGVEVIRE